MPEEGTDLTPKDALLTTAEILRLVMFLAPQDACMMHCHLTCPHTVMLLLLRGVAGVSFSHLAPLLHVFHLVASDHHLSRTSVSWDEVAAR